MLFDLVKLASNFCEVPLNVTGFFLLIQQLVLPGSNRFFNVISFYGVPTGVFYCAATTYPRMVAVFYDLALFRS